MKVCKFGGTSLADAGQVRKVCDIVAADRQRRIVVVSAPGKRDKADAKVTDMLIRCAELRLAGREAREELHAIAARFEEIQKGLGLSADVAVEIGLDLRARSEQTALGRAAFLDLMKAAGEDNMAKLVAEALTHRGLPADYVDPREAGMRLTEEHGNARLLPESYAELARLKGAKNIVVFPGFFGCTREGKVVTFSRGGSDITGSILAAAVGAEVYENFTDVDSVFAVDPRIVPDAQPIDELTFREMRELSYAGFSVLHDEAIIPAVAAGVPICIKNTNRPQGAGTRIVRERRQQTHVVVGIASKDGFCTINMNKFLMNREIGFGRLLLQIVEDENLSYEHMPSGIDNVSIILRSDDVDAAREERLVGRLERELGCADIVVERGLALIMLVGEGMRYAIGTAARATGALAGAGVNIEMLNQGASEISMMYGVKESDRQRAVESLYRAFFPEPAAGRRKGRPRATARRKP